MCYGIIGLKQLLAFEMVALFLLVPSAFRNDSNDDTRASQSLQTVTTIDENGGLVSTIGGQYFSASFADKEILSFRLTQAKPPASEKPYEVRSLEIEVFVKEKPVTVFKGVCRMSSLNDGSPSGESMTQMLCIASNGEMLTIPTNSLSTIHDHPDSTSVRYTSKPIAETVPANSYELMSVKVELLSKGKITKIFEGICQTPVTNGKVFSISGLQDQQEINNESPDKVTREYAEMNRFVGQGRTIVNAPLVASNDKFPTVGDNSLYYNMFRDQNFSMEMQIIPDQQREIDQAIRKATESLNLLHEQFRSLDSSDQKEKMLKQAEKLVAELDEEYERILAPQLKLLNRKLLANHLKRDGIFQVMINSGLHSQLGVSDAQRLKMFETLSDISDETSKQFAEMHKSATKRVEECFSEDQRNKVLSMTGAQNLEELMPPDFSRLYGQIVRARHQMSQDDSIQKKLNNRTSNK